MADDAKKQPSPKKSRKTDAPSPEKVDAPKQTRAKPRGRPRKNPA